MTALPLLAALLARTLLVSASDGSAAPGFTAAASTSTAAATVTVEGMVKATGAPALPRPVAVTRDARSCGASQPGESWLVSPDGGLANVVVSLRPLAAPPPRPGAGTPATIDQVGCRYRPHVQAVTTGSELVLVNSDRVLHNVHANLGAVTVFNLAMPIKGQRLPTRLTRPGLVRLQCDAGHTWMNAWIQVFDHPYHAVTDERGHFRIAGVPAGAYLVDYWHEPLDGKGQGVTRTIRLRVGQQPVRADAVLSF